STSASWSLGPLYANTSVDVLADGFWISDVPVDGSGNIILDREVRSLVVGYRYKSRLRSLDLEPNFAGGSGEVLHWLKSINYVHIRMHRSYGGWICAHDVNQLERIPYENDDMIVHNSLKLFTGD